MGMLAYVKTPPMMVIQQGKNAIAETPEAPLCYKNEHSITLKVSSTRYQRIFTVRKDEEEANDEKATIRYSDISVASSG